MQNPPSKPKLKPEVKKLWTKALKSGNYKQGRGALCKGDQFCCLGVLCDIHRIKVLKKGTQFWKEFPECDQKAYYEDEVVLPVEVAKWAFTEFNENIGKSRYINPSVEHSTGGCLAEINDQRVPFTEIAKVIEEQL